MLTPVLIRRRSFIDRYVFPDGELRELGAVVSRMQALGFEVRHVEGLREHYSLTLRAWVRTRSDPGTTRWSRPGKPGRGSGGSTSRPALNFEAGRVQIHQRSR